MVLTLLGFVALMFLWRVVSIFWSQEFVFSRRMAYVTAAGVWFAITIAAFLEMYPVNPVSFLWTQIALVAGVGLIFTLRYRHMHRCGRTVISFWVDFGKYCTTMLALVAVLMIFADRMFSLMPFGALMVGVLSIFIPVNCMAEVLHNGLKERHRRLCRT